MHTWAKRGLKTALVTGGLLMLGTGIASADENVNPDLPPSPLDVSVTIPVHIDNNALSTPLGQVDLPGVNHDITITPSDLTRAFPATGAVAPKSDGSAMSHGDALRDNKIVGDLVVPVDVSGNAIAVLSDASVTNDSTQEVAHATPIATSGADSGLAGNVVALQYALPVQITGNAVAAGGNADTYNTATQSATAGDDIATDGTHGAISGNILAPQGATPVGLNGNAVAAAGNSTADSATSAEAITGGTLTTAGDEGAVAGNAAGVPIALPIQGNGNSLGAVGNAETFSSSDAVAQAGEEVPSAWDEQYITTSGSPAAVSGNIIQPAVAGPVGANCNAGAAAGNSDAACTSSGDAAAGGGNLTSGERGVISGAIAHAPIAIPTQASGNAAGAVGNAGTEAVNAVSSTAGADSFTNGDGSVLGGAIAQPSVASPIDACGNTAAGAGQSGAFCTNDTVTESGGGGGTRGFDSVGGGNEANVPVALPVEGLGNTVGAAGFSETSMTEDKTVSSGGGTSTLDDAGTLAANLVTVPVSGPVQVTGNGAGAAANTSSATDITSDITAGGPTAATGAGGSLAGNIVSVPAAIPTQVFSDGATVVGEGTTNGHNDVSSTSGGTAESTGEDGTGSGNVVAVPAASAIQSFGEGAGVLGSNDAAAASNTATNAGGTVLTNGAGGALAGNVVSPQAMPLVQSFGAAVSGVGGQDTATAVNDTAATSGGDITSTGDNGFLAGNLFDIPAGAFVLPHGDAVAAVGSQSLGTSASDVTGTASGVSTTSGEAGSLSGIDGTLPVGVQAPIYDVPVEVLADAMTESTNSTEMIVGEQGPQLALPQAGGLEATSLPRLPGSQARSAAGDPISSLLGGLLGGNDLLGGLLGGLGGGGLTGRSLPVAAPALPLTGLPIALPTSGLPLSLPTGLPTAAPRFAAPAMPGLDNLAGVFSGNLVQAPSLNRLPVQTPAVAGMAGPAALPTIISGGGSLADTQSKLAGVFGG
jgi:hypothetical protein